MADLRVERRLRHDNGAALDVLVHHVDAESGSVVDVVEAVRDVRRDLHPRRPRRQHREVGVDFAPEAQP